VDDDAIEAVVHTNRQAGKQLCEKFYRSSVLRSCLDNSIIGRTTGGIRISIFFWLGFRHRRAIPADAFAHGAKQAIDRKGLR
jgi:hypothetical protein